MATLKLQTPRRRWLVAWVWMIASLYLLSPGVHAAGFSVAHVDTELRDEVYYLNAELDLYLTDAVIEALESGVPITLELQIEVVNPRDWWWDETAYALSQRYLLKFHALTRQYVLTNLNSRVQHTYPTRAAALGALSSINRLPILDRSALRVGVNYLGRLRVRLALEQLPSPLRVWAYLSSDWDLSSDWHQWPLQ